MKRGILLVFLCVQAGCITYGVSPMEVRWLDRQPETPPVEVAVQILQSETEEFKEHSESGLNSSAKEYNRAVLQYIRARLEASPGVRANPSADFHVTIASIVPESSRNSIPVGCLAIATVFVFPVFASYDYPVEITLYHRNTLVKKYTYSYSSGYSIGWLLIPFNILVTPFVDSFYASTESRLKGIDSVFEAKVLRVNRWILKDLREFQAPPPDARITLREP